MNWHLRLKNVIEFLLFSLLCLGAAEALADDEAFTDTLPVLLTWLTQFTVFNLNSIQRNDYHFVCFSPEGQLGNTMQPIATRPVPLEFRSAPSDATVYEKTEFLRKRISEDFTNTWQSTISRLGGSVKTEIFEENAVPGFSFSGPCTAPQMNGIKRTISPEYNRALKLLADLHAHHAVLKLAIKNPEGNCGELTRIVSFVLWLRHPEVLVAHACLSHNQLTHTLAVISPPKKSPSKRLSDWENSSFIDPWGTIGRPELATYSVKSFNGMSPIDLFKHNPHAFHTICEWETVKIYPLKNEDKINLSGTNAEFEEWFSDEIHRIRNSGLALFRTIQEEVSMKSTSSRLSPCN